MDTTFCLRDSEHYCIVAGRVFGPWPNHGAALAGLQTEQRRAAARLHPYCNVCGWRKGGLDSWNGRACKCRLSEPPMPIITA